MDVQELNQGTYIHNGVLHGLSTKLKVEDLRNNCSANKLRSLIASEAPFLSSVREHRLTNFKGIHCSNVFTMFLSSAIDSDECIESLKSVVKYAHSCENCIKNKLDCNYKKLVVQCSNCAKDHLSCVSLNIFHLLWDMGSSHKKISKTINKITKISTDTELESSTLFTIGMGGLHLGKAATNTSRNHSLSYQ